MAVFGLLGLTGTQSGAAIAGRPEGRLSPATGALFGAHVVPLSGTTQTDVKNAVTALESAITRPLDVNGHTYEWAQPFPTWAETWDLSSGRIPMITWGGTGVSTITSGSQDALIRARADAVKALGKPVFLRWFPDMNSGSSPPAPASFIAAWKRIHGIFKTRGATNAVWVWCPNAAGFADGSAPPYFPGASYVEWICADGYNWAPVKAGASWRTFQQIFDPFYTWAKTRGKPLMIGETGVLEGTAGQKPKWMWDARTTLKQRYPAVQAMVYTHARMTYPGVAGTYDWRGTTSAASTRELMLLARDPHFHRPRGRFIGAFVKPPSRDPTAVRNAVTATETRIGRKLDIDHLYYQWDDAFPVWQEAWDLQQGRTPMLSWAPIDVDLVNSGSLDAWIAARAEEVRDLGQPVLLRWFYEADAAQLQPLAQSPAEYIAAWRRVHGIFTSRGAHNVSWAWCMTAWGFKTGTAQTYYPGDAYVDWVCADGYNWAPGKPGASWVSFKDIFSGFYPWAAARNKPVMIGETGVMERNTGEKASWITAMRETIKTTYPRIRALVWLDGIASSYEGGSYDWRINTSSSSLTAFKNMVADPAFRR